MGAFTCVGWQVTLCDPIWQVTSRISEMGFPQEELYRPLRFFLDGRPMDAALYVADCDGLISVDTYLLQEQSGIKVLA